MGSTPLSLKDNLLPLYFQKDYLNVHNDNNIVVYNDGSFMIPFALNDKTAYSFKQSPFGSFIKSGDIDYDTFQKFEKEVVQELIQKGVQKVIIRHPPNYYNNFISDDWLIQAGYQATTKDINQYINLSESVENQLHKMEKRKLLHASRDELLFTNEKVSALEEVHSFITMCRKAAGLVINIDAKKLKSLVQSFPSQYKFYTIRKKQEILAACIVAIPTPNIFYYYLPATNPKYKSMSPMVSLLVFLIDLFQSKGGSIFDLGLSSINGVRQEGLYTFKKRMGALEIPSLLYEKIIS